MLFDLMSNVLGGDGLKQIASNLGTDDKTTANAVSAALPLLIGALSKNAASAQGASSLDHAVARDHDGSILNDIAGYLGKGQTAPGDAILRHILGGKRSNVESALSRTSGLDSASIGKLLSMLAPIVMGTLGRAKQQQNLDAGGLAGLLQGETTRVKQASSSKGLLSLLDMDGDGDVVDDVTKIGASLLGNLFKNR